MNHTYRLVWNRTLSMFVAVSECARTMGKSSGGKALALATVVMAAASAPALAVPYTTVIDTTQASYNASTLAPSGTIQFQGGTLRTDVNGATQSQGFTIDSHGAFVDQFGMTSNFTGAIADAAGGFPGAMTIVNSGSGGAVTFSGNTTYSGATTIMSGAMLTLAGAAQLSSSNVVNNGALNIGNLNYGLATVNGLAGSGSVNLGDINLWIAHASGDFSGSIGGTGGLVIQNGTQNLSGTSGYSGDTQLQAGTTLTLNGGGKLTASAVQLSSGATLDISGGAGTVGSLYGGGAVVLGANTLTLSGSQYGNQFTGTVTGTGGLTFTGGNHFVNSALAYTGATQLNAGASLYLGDTGSLASSSNVIMNGGNLTAYASTGGIALTSLGGTSGNVVLNGVNLTLSNASGNFGGALLGTGGLVVAAGTETLSGASFNTGATTIASGATLALAGAGSIATSSGVAANGTFDISAANGQVSVTNLSGTGTGSVALGAHTLALTAASGSYGGIIGGTGGLTIAGGQLNLSQYAYYSGQTTVNAGAALTLSGGASLYSSAVVDNGVLDVSASTAGAVAVNSLAGSGTVVLGATNLGINTASGNFSGSISGTGGLTIAAGTQTFSGINTYSATTQVASGATLKLAGNGQLASAVQLNAGAILDVSGAVSHATVGNVFGAGAVQLGANTLTLAGTPGNYTFTGTVSGSGGLSLNNGNYFFNSALGYTGVTQLNTGASLYLGGSGSIAASSNVIMNGGNLTVYASTGGATIAGLSGATGNVTVNDVNLTLSGASGTYGGGIAGTGGLTVAAGTQTLSSYAAYTGQTTVNSGAALILSSNGALYGTNVVNNGTLDVSGTTYGTGVNSLAGSGVTALGARSLGIYNAGGTYAGTFTGTGLVNIVAGTQALSGASTNNGYYVVGNGAALALLGNGKVANSVVQVSSGGVFDVSGVVAQASAAALAGNGAVHLGSNTLTLNGVGVNGYMFEGAVTGTGGLTFTGGNHAFDTALAYTGATQVNTGATVSLVAGASMAASSGVVMNGGTFYLQSFDGTTVKSLSGASGAVNLNSVLTLSNASGSFGGTVSGFGAGGLAIAGGTETLSGTLSYMGATRVDAGAHLVITGPGTGIATSASVLDNGSIDISGTTGATSFKNLSGTGALVLGARTTTLGGATADFGGVVSGTGGLVVSATAQTLSGVNTYTGTTLIAAPGTLVLGSTGSIAASSTVTANGMLDLSNATSVNLKGLAGAATGKVKLGATALTIGGTGGVFQGVISGAGSLRLASNATTLRGVNTYTGSTTVDAGATLALANGGSIAASSGLIDNGLLDIGAAGGSASIAGLTGAGTVALGANSLAISAAAGTFDGSINGAGGFGVTGGIQTLSQVQTYTGATTVSPGAKLILAGSGSIGASSGLVDDGIFDISGATGAAQLATLSGSGAVALGANQLTLTAANGVFAGVVQGAGKLAIAAGYRDAQRREQLHGRHHDRRRRHAGLEHAARHRQFGSSGQRHARHQRIERRRQRGRPYRRRRRETGRQPAGRVERCRHLCRQRQRQRRLAGHVRRADAHRREHVHGPDRNRLRRRAGDCRRRQHHQFQRRARQRHADGRHQPAGHHDEPVRQRHAEPERPVGHVHARQRQFHGQHHRHRQDRRRRRRARAGRQ